MILQGDCLEIMRTMPDDSVDLVMCSPPYENVRAYGELEFKLSGQDWVDWAVERYKECVRVCKGLVCWVVEGKTRNFRWSATPALLMADLHRAGVRLRKPPVFHRIGIAGSGGREWLRNDWEFCVCSSKGKLPWANNTAMGHIPKWGPGGAMSHRLSDGSRVNQWGHPIDSGATVTEKGGVVRSRGKRPSHFLSGKMAANATEPKCLSHLEGEIEGKLHTKRNANGTRVQCYTPPVLANPGNVIKCNVGGGIMGSKLCHENEAPYPELLAEWFVLSFCPPDGTVLDPYCGSGTTLAVAARYGRKFIGIDLRQSMVDLSNRRVAEVQPCLPMMR